MQLIVFKEEIEKFNKLIFLNFISIIFVIDFLTKIHLVYNVFFKISSYVKLIIELFLCFYFFMFLKSTWKKDKNIKFILIFPLIFVIGQFNEYLINEKYNIEYFFHSIFRLNTYLYLILFIIIIKKFDKKDYEKIILSNVSQVKIIAGINFFLIILGLFFEINLFKSYPYTPRFGYNGIITSSGTASFFYVFLIVILYNDFILYKRSLLLIAVLFSSFLIGTKTILLFIALVFLIHWTLVFDIKKKNIAFALGLVSIMTALKFQEKIKVLIFNLFPFEELYRDHSALTLLLSTRDLHFKESLIRLKLNSNFFTYLFGGISDKEFFVEFEFYFLFLFLGVFGIVTYAAFLKENFYMKNQSIIKSSLFLSVILTCSLSGALFYSVFSSILFYFAFKYIDMISLNK